MRVKDLPLPRPDNDPDCDTHGFHVAINIFLNNNVNGLWDTAKWDTDLWTSTETWLDISEDVQGCVVDRPPNDVNTQPNAAQLSIQLDNSKGLYSQFDDQGNQSTFAVGGQILVWQDDEWKFSGRITRWEENYGEGPDPDSRRAQSNVQIEAFDTLFLLNQGIDGLSYSLGTEGQTTPQRLVSLLALLLFPPGTKFDADPMTHRSIQSTNPILESLQITVESAGGMIFIDNDGQIMFLNQASTQVGRSDQPEIPVISDVCSPETWNFWEGDPVTDDDLIRNDIVLTNVDGARVEVKDQLSIDRRLRRLLSREDQTWADSADATTVANNLINLRSNAYFHVDPIVFYGTAPILRVGDVVRYVRTLHSGTRVDVNLLVIGTSWDHSPTGEVTTISSAPVSGVNAFSRWDTAVWDTDTWALP